MKKTFILLLFLLPLIARAQELKHVRYNCMVAGESLAGSRQDAPRRPLTLMTQWDSTRVYPVAVVLVQFADTAFSSPDPLDRYNRIFNEEGYNEGKGAGCVADYFRHQSDGMFNPRFDIYGPITSSTTLGSSGGGLYGNSIFCEALDSVVANYDVDFSIYDWDSDGRAESTVFIYAASGGNESANNGKGYFWPSTGGLSRWVNAGGTLLTSYSASAELWAGGALCGIGTVCHEFSHALGLPDIYPTDSSSPEFSVCDEWDLMDGGNFTNRGWCPPNYTAHEKMLMGWYTPEELTAPASVEGLAPISQGGKALLIPTTKSDEFFILENRQWEGWDLCSPGHGLLVAHVCYDASLWRENRVNNTPSAHHYDYVHADNLDYTAWDSIVGKSNPYTASKGVHSRYLSTTPYPFVTDSTANRSLTDSSIPAATLADGTPLSAPITDIIEAPDGTVSFVFMDYVPDAIADIPVSAPPASAPAAMYRYDLTGRRVGPGYKGLVVSRGKLVMQ